MAIRDVGPWSSDKHHFLRRYVDAFTSAMGKKPRWTGLHYIDLFGGAGIERIRGGGLEWGSPLIAAMNERRFDQLHVCELDRTLAAALTARLNQFPQPSVPRVIVGDANAKVSEVVAAVPRGTLNLAFVDPCQLSQLRFSTLEVLAQRRTDIIVFFPDYTDALRALDVYKGRPDSALSQYLGTQDWENEIEKVSWENRAAALVQVFRRQMEGLGYGFIEEERIFRRDNKRLYKLVFCSKDKTGAEIWTKVSKAKPDRQGRLF